MGFSEALGLDVPNLMKNVPNFVKDVQRVRKCVPKWGSTPNHFVMGFLKKLWTIHVEMGVLESIGSNVPNLMKNVPNLIKDVPNFVKDVPKVKK